MNFLPKICTHLSIDNRLQKLIFQTSTIPYHDDYNSVNDYWYPHPPCLIPLFLGYGASYKGFLKHFFCVRKITFIEFNLENAYFYEIAKNTNQLISLLLLHMVIIKDEVSEAEFKSQMQHLN